jgi:uncharacterized phage protein (TIGR01671 family)
MNNREFKFRVWDKVNKAYCHCGELNFLSRNTSKLLDGKIRLSGQPISSNLETYLTANDADVCMPHANPKPYVIEQYTGVKDKNGREIYEGDIIEYTQHLFNTEKTKQKKKLINYIAREAKFNVYETAAGQTDHTIIGNIHENPELLEQ